MIEYYLIIMKTIKKLRKTNTILLFINDIYSRKILIIWEGLAVKMRGQNKDHYEKRKHSSLYVPFSYYESVIPDFFPFVPMHSHQEWELNFVTEGEGKLGTDRSQYRMESGDIVLLCPYTLHAIESTERIVYHTVVFHSNMLGITGDRCYSEEIAPFMNHNAELIYIKPDNVYYEELHRAAQMVVTCAKGNTARLDLRMKSELLRFLWFAGESGACVTTESDMENDQIRQVIDFIHDNYGEPLSLEEMAEQANLSKSWFMQRFKETTGISAMEYLNRLRVQKVCEQILDGKGISEIAFACGFRNLSNFNRIFKNIVGMTPREYLYQYKDGKEKKI